MTKYWEVYTSGSIEVYSGFNTVFNYCRHLLLYKNQYLYVAGRMISFQCRRCWNAQKVSTLTYELHYSRVI